MHTPEQLAGLLRAADTSWDTARGVTRHWRRHRLVTKGFERSIPSPQLHAVFVSSEGDAGDYVFESVLRVAFERNPPRTRIDAISRDHHESWLPDNVVIDGDTFWARDATSIMTNDGDPHSTIGAGTEIRALLEPSAVPLGFDLEPTGQQETIAGRLCVVATATPRPPGDSDLELPVDATAFSMIHGGTDFSLSIDMNTGVLLRVIKLVDSETAEICEFLEVTFDEPLDAALFAPLT
jgi:hypothetical protein